MQVRHTKANFKHSLANVSAATKLCFLLLTSILFLAIQLLSSLHMAEHEFKKHEHNGQTCVIGIFYAENNAKSGSSSIPSLPLLITILCAVLLASSKVPQLIPFGGASIHQARAPPRF